MSDDYRGFVLTAAPLAARVANYCDHVEHNEEARTSWVTDAGHELQGLALEFAARRKLDLLDLYANRLRAVEQRNVLAHEGTFDGYAATKRAKTWRDLQIVQAEHDRIYHADVVGLAKIEQLRHYTLHLAKIVGAFALRADTQELIERRLPDSLLFSIKLQTVMGARLSDEPLPSCESIAGAGLAGRVDRQNEARIRPLTT